MLYSYKFSFCLYLQFMLGIYYDFKTGVTVLMVKELEILSCGSEYRFSLNSPLAIFQ